MTSQDFDEQVPMKKTLTLVEVEPTAISERLFQSTPSPNRALFNSAETVIEEESKYECTP